MAGEMRRANGNIVAMTDRVCVAPYKFKQYKTVFDDRFTSTRDGSPLELIAGYSEIERVEEHYSDRAILDNLLNLAHKMHLSPTSDKAKGEVVKWCKRYGMPFLGIRNWRSGDFPDNVEPEDRYNYCLKKAGYVFFDYETLKIELQRLYRAFTLAAQLFGVNIGVDDTLFDIFGKDYNGWPTEEKEFILSSRIQSHCSNNIEFVGGKPSLFLFFDDHIEVAKYQLMLLTLSPDGYGIKRCKHCQNLFACDRANRLYCNYCNRKKHHAQKKRQEEKSMVEEVATTLLNVYSHATQSAQEKAAQAMDDVLFRNTKGQKIKSGSAL